MWGYLDTLGQFSYFTKREIRFKFLKYCGLQRKKNVKNICVRISCWLFKLFYALFPIVHQFSASWEKTRAGWNSPLLGRNKLNFISSEGCQQTLTFCGKKVPWDRQSEPGKAGYLLAEPRKLFKAKIREAICTPPVGQFRHTPTCTVLHSFGITYRLKFHQDDDGK